MKKNTIYITMMCLLAFMVTSSSAFGWVTQFGVVDNAALTEDESGIGTHVGVVIVNQSTQNEIFSFEKVLIANTPIIGGEYGKLNLATDVLNRNNIGTLSSDGILSEGLLTVDPGEAVYVSAQILSSRGVFRYDGGTFSSAPFEVDTQGIAASYMSIEDSFHDGTFLGTVGVGRDDVAAWSFQTAAVPEPSNYPLIAGLIGLSWVVMRRKVS